MADEHKPHPATPKKREETRSEGNFPKARDATFIAVMAAVLAVFMFGHGRIVETIHTVFHRTHGDLLTITRGGAGELVASLPRALANIIVPQAVAAAVVGAAVGAWLAGLRLYPKVFKPKFSKLNPLPKLKELVSPKKALFELALAILRVGIIGLVCYDTLASDIPTLLGLTGAAIGESLTVVAVMLLKMVLKVLAVLIVLAVIDYAYSRHRLEEQMKMSDQEVKEEMRQYDQDPLIKRKIKEKMREAARRRVIAAVGESDVVVTNPTHLSVALRYSETDFAPIVVAKGHDQLALRMRAEARKHSIPIVENRPLARALYAEVEMGQPVPGAHYVAVAKILAFVFQLPGARRRRQPTTEPEPAPAPAPVPESNR